LLGERDDDADPESIYLAIENRFSHFTTLDWMAQLEKLVVIKRHILAEDLIVTNLLKTILNKFPMVNLYRLWIQNDRCLIDRSEIPDFSNTEMQMQMLSLNGYELDGNQLELSRLTHVSRVAFSSGFLNFPCLRFVNGFCNDQWVI